MKNRFDLRGDLLEIRALYSVPALARIAKVSADMLRRVLRAANVELLRSGRVILPAACSAFHGFIQGRTPCSRSAMILLVTLL